MTIQEIIQKNKERLNELLKTMNDATALRFYLFYPKWDINTKYTTGERIHHNGSLYRVLENHVSAEDMKPDVMMDKFEKVIIKATEE